MQFFFLGVQLKVELKSGFFQNWHIIITHYSVTYRYYHFDDKNHEEKELGNYELFKIKDVFHKDILGSKRKQENKKKS